MEQSELGSLRTELAAYRDELKWASDQVKELRSQHAPDTEVSPATQHQLKLQSRINAVLRQLRQC